MSNPLVDDFIGDIKEIPEDESVEQNVIPMYLPLYTDPVGIPVQPIIDMTAEERYDAFKEFISNIRSVCSMFHDMANLNKSDNPDEIIDDIRDALLPYADSIGLKLELNTDNKAVETMCIMAQVYGFLTEITRFMSVEYKMSYDYENDQVIEVTSEDVDEEPTMIDDDLMQDIFNVNSIEGLYAAVEKHAQKSDDNDEYFTDMLAAEMMGATDGEPFTKDELYGDDKK